MMNFTIDRLGKVGDTRETWKFPKPVAVKWSSSTFIFFSKIFEVRICTVFCISFIFAVRASKYEIRRICVNIKIHLYEIPTTTSRSSHLTSLLGLVFSRRRGRVRFASREQRRPCIIIWYVCARAVNTCCASSMKYVLTPESDALEAFPARPCNIYVLLVTSCIVKSHFSGRNACLYSDSFSRVQRKHKTAARVYRDDIVRRCMISSLIVSNELSNL